MLENKIITMLKTLEIWRIGKIYRAINILHERESQESWKCEGLEILYIRRFHKLIFIRYNRIIMFIIPSHFTIVVQTMLLIQF